jgi:tetratricopeptide (TPR) repeat protein
LGITDPGAEEFMIVRSKRIRKGLILATLVVGLLTLRPPATLAQTQTQDDPDTALMRREALDLYRHGKFVDAMPLLEKLSSLNPNDYVVKEHYAYCMLEYSATLRDPEARKKARQQARALGLEAQKQGDQSDLLQTLVAIPEDGSETKFSERADVNEGMKAAEADFARGDLDKAREGYQHVLELDPKNYEATLFVGDVYFKQRAYNSANEWFGKAVQINADRETAYRYWGDSLAMVGKNDEAREQYIKAVIAEPYTRSSWVALRQWCDRTRQPFNAILLQNKSSAKPAGNATATALDEHALDQSNPETAGWNAYNAARATWQQGKFKTAYPKETTYRRSMKEEADALEAMVKVLAPEATSEAKAKKLDPTLLQLIQIDHEGLLEPFVFLNRADPEIAQDYPAYRAEHRDKLYRYMNEFVLPKTSAQAAN